MLFRSLPEGWADGRGMARFVAPGILVIQGPRYRVSNSDPHPDMLALSQYFEAHQALQLLDGIALITVVDDADFASASFENWMWICFTRSQPSHDVHGIFARQVHKHWGCDAPLFIDARIKPHHAPPLEDDPEVTRRIEALAASGGPLHGLF